MMGRTLAGMGESTLPPGPRLPSTLQALLWAYQYPRFTQNAHRRFGSTFTVRVGGLPTSVCTVDRDAVRRLHSGDPLDKRHGNDVLRAVVGDRSMMVLEPREHLERRKLLLPPFHGDRVRGYAALMQRLVDHELDRWRVGEVVRVQPIAQALTLEVILQAVLGISDPGLRERLRGIFDWMVAQPGSALGFYFPVLTDRKTRNPLARRFWRAKDEVDRLLRVQVQATRTDPALAEREDILALLVVARDEAGDGLDDTDLVDELNTLILAGHETTATAIAWGAELLVHHPEVLARARAAADGGDDEYLDALVKEILRIRTPIPVASARHSRQPFAIGEYEIPPECTIIVNAHGLHMDPALWPEPHAFRPERFIGAKPQPHSFLPFGGGAHRCIGAALAQLEMKVVLRAMVTRFDLAPAARAPERGARRGIVIAPRRGGEVRVVRGRDGQTKGVQRPPGALVA